MKRKIIFIAILLVIMSALFLATKNRDNQISQKNITLERKYSNYYCREGEINVSFYDNNAVLNLEGNRELILKQRSAASGSIYESNSSILTIKDNNAYLVEDGKNTYSNCILGYETNKNSDEIIFTDSTKTFSFVFPQNYKISGGGNDYVANWRSNTRTNGILLTSLLIPSSVQPHSNFQEAKFTVGVSGEPQAIKNCLIANNGEVSEGEKNINGQKYNVFVLDDAGAGNFYTTMSYRTIKDDQCYALEHTIHSTNIGNYSPDQNIKEFDKSKITTILEKIVNSFVFIK